MATYDRLRFEMHIPRAEAAREAKVSYHWATNRDRAMGGLGTNPSHKDQRDQVAQFGEVPIEVEDLCEEARRAREDYAYFRRRYFGRVDVPWQITAGEQIVDLLATEHKEFVVVNCPPGSGKTTAFTHDLAAWLTVRDRQVRGIMGHRIYTTAELYTGRLRRTLERRFPMEAKDDDVPRGLATDAVAVIPNDYGPFRPGHENQDLWQKGRFVVAQLGDRTITEKEPTWTAFGMDSGSLGYRVDVALWDDLTARKIVRSADLTAEQQVWWDDEGETRLDPGGLLVLIGQRLGPHDIYRYCLDKLAADFDTDEDFDVDDAMDLATIVGDEPDVARKYHHIIYRAHDDDRCSDLHGGTVPRGSEHHRLTAKPWPYGCLLDPRRLSWRELSGIRRNNPDRYETVYQQRDMSSVETLIDPVWIAGGVDRNGFEAPGCWDPNRSLCQMPHDLAGGWGSFASVDPSVEQRWAIQWWIVHWESGMRYLMDIEDRKLQMGEFLDRDRTGRFFGVAEELQQRSRAVGAPIQAWVVERNAAHRYLLANNTWRFWTASHKVRTLPHSTGANKADPDYGVQGLLRPVYMYGQVNLPGDWHGDSRGRVMKLVDQVTRWGHGGTDDQVMAHWFLEHNLPSLRSVDPTKMKRLWRPSWMKEATAR